MRAGDYTERFQWFRWAPTQDTDTNQDVDHWASNGFLWGSVDETNGRREEGRGATQTGADAEIRLRNYPEITAQDRLLDTYGVYWSIDYLRRGDNEMLLQVHRYDAGQPEGTP